MSVPRVFASPHSEPGVIVCTANGQVCWVGPIKNFDRGAGVDAIYCHDRDEATVRAAVNAPAKKPQVALKPKPAD